MNDHFDLDKEIKNREKILIIKDSYANSMIPFLTQNFEEVHVIDLRSYSNSVLEYINYNKILFKKDLSNYHNIIMFKLFNCLL